MKILYIIYTGEHLKWHTAGVLCFKSSPIPHPWRFTPFRIQNAQRGPPFSLITAHEVGVLNEKRCKTCRFKSSRVYINKDDVYLRVHFPEIGLYNYPTWIM